MNRVNEEWQKAIRRSYYRQQKSRRALRRVDGDKPLVVFTKNVRRLSDSIGNTYTERPAMEGLPKAISDALGGLKERERKVIVLRFFEGLRLDQVGRLFKVTRERIRQIENRAIARLRNPEFRRPLSEFMEELAEISAA